MGGEGGRAVGEEGREARGGALQEQQGEEEDGEEVVQDGGEVQVVVVERYGKVGEERC